jgi:hypothetical protein
MRDKRLEQVRREAGLFPSILSSDALELIARLDLAERRIAAALALLPNLTGAAKAAADQIGAALRRGYYPDPDLASDGDARGASPADRT